MEKYLQILLPLTFFYGIIRILDCAEDSSVCYHHYEPFYVEDEIIACVMFNEQQHTWNDARKECEKHGGTLINLSKRDLCTPVIDYLKNNKKTDDYWIGAVAKLHENATWIGTNKKVDGSGKRGIVWCNGFTPPLDDENLCYRLVYNCENGYFGMYDYPCSQSLKFICQSPPITDAPQS